MTRAYVCGTEPGWYTVSVNEQWPPQVFDTPTAQLALERAVRAAKR